MTPWHKGMCWLGLICLCSAWLLVPLTACAQPPPKQATLAELLALTRKLVTDSADMWPEGFVDIGSDENPKVISSDGNELVGFFSTIGFMESEEIEAYARVPSKNPDIRRITRLIECNVFDTFNGKHVALSGKIDRQGDARIPGKWFVGPALDGSLWNYQGLLLLSPMGLLSREQVDYVIAALRATGPYEPLPPANVRAKIIRTFAEEVHGAKDSYSPAPDVTTESLIFDGKASPNPDGAQIIISQEAPGRFALFVLMGGVDFTQDREKMCR